jgi:hypothetical protein
MPTEPFTSMKDILFGYDTDIHFENDDLMQTSGLDFMEREIYKVLITLPGDWKADPTIGISPNKYTGEQNTRDVAREIQEYISEGLRLTVTPALPSVRVVPVANDKIMIFIDLLIANFQRITIPFEFDYINGIKKFTKLDSRVTEIDSSSNLDINNISKLRRPNKYWARMSYNATNQT